MRNLSDECKTCRDNDKSMMMCIDICSIPTDILDEIEHKRMNEEMEEKRDQFEGNLRVERDMMRMEYIIRINDRELYNAFSSKEHFNRFIRDMLIYTVGEEKAKELFPITEERVEEHDN